MLELAIPGRTTLRVAHLVLDYNGTLALDGNLLPGVADRVSALAERLDVHVITADTFGLAAVELGHLPVTLQIIGAGDQARAKLALIESLGAERVIAVGNGANDRLMLERAALGICVLGLEGAATPTLLASDVVVRGPIDAFDLLLHPGRLAATLRI
ncbi:MAG TPA: ATPase P [Symbiobacteriaceae bacterium]|nr:ATPase P [Symbiobacteriaceae bacterium]